MAENIATIVDWYGPLAGKDRAGLLTSAYSAAKNDFNKGFYAAVGRSEGARRGPRELLYIGVGTRSIYRRLVPAHHVFGKAHINISQLWLGEVSVAGIPGRRRKRWKLLWNCRAPQFKEMENAGIQECRNHIY